jgi:hypothetical protein
MEKLKTLNFGTKLYNRLISLYPELVIKKKKENMIMNHNMIPAMGMHNMVNTPMKFNQNYPMNMNFNPFLNNFDIKKLMNKNNNFRKYDNNQFY